MKDILLIAELSSTITSYNGKSEAIFVAGDNDIGGEGGDRVTKEKVSRFKKHFPSKPVHTFSGKSKAILEIIPVNILTQAESDTEDTDLNGYPKHLDKDSKDHLVFRMIVSHLPIMPLQQLSLIHI